jgi:uncharacterized coiled-coil DUF342 family protein
MEEVKIAEYATAISIGLIGLVYGIQKIIKGWKETGAETSVITLMHQELSRMSAQNKVLSDELAALQSEIIKLNRELRKMSDENQKLHQEVVSLTAEVSRLRELLNVQT